MKKTAAVLVFLLLASALGAFLLLDTHESRGWVAKKILIPKGIALPEVARILSDEGILKRPLVFRLLVAGTGTGTRLMYGEYFFPVPPSALTVWRKMIQGDVKKYVFTVFEGFNIHDIAEDLEEIGLLDAEDFIDAATSPFTLARLGFPERSAEGYLFPDTYIFSKPVTADEILAVMLRRFRKKFTKEMESKAADAGFSLHEIVTIASIIEKETGVEQEKPLISAVIRKRLSLGMPLQMDPTVTYGLKRFGENLTKTDLRRKTPYNTYVNRGLPQGPISNPGLASLQAALSPAGSDFLYFVSRNDGSHVFSRTLQEHNRAVSRYQRSSRPEG